MRKFSVLLCFVTAIGHPLIGQSQSSSDAFYYRIGGGQLSDSARYRWNEFTLNLDPYASASYSCGDIDLDESLKSLIRDLESIPDEFETYLKEASIDLLYGLVALSLQKAAPGMYEYLTNAYIRHKEYLQVRLASCKRIESLVADGEINQLKDLAKMVEWRRAIEQGTPVQEAEAEVDGRKGIPWVGGEYYGGEGQKPIRLVEHSIAKGYENLVGSGTTGDTSSSAMAYYFPSSEDAKEWGVSVLGDKVISFTGDSQSVTGSGLQTVISQTTESVKLILNAAVINPSGTTQEQLDQLSTPNFRLTVPALAAIGARAAEHQSLLKNRLASEIATLQELEKVYLIRDYIVSAMDEPHVFFGPLRRTHFPELLAKIDDDIRVARDKAAIRREFMGELLIQVFDTRDELEDQPTNMPGFSEPREPLRGTGILKK